MFSSKSLDENLCDVCLAINIVVQRFTVNVGPTLSMSGGGLHFGFDILLEQSTAVVPAFFRMSDKKRGEMEREGCWRMGGGGGTDMHLSPISSNPLHNSSALSLLPRLRTIRPDAH